MNFNLYSEFETHAVILESPQIMSPTIQDIKNTLMNYPNSFIQINTDDGVHELNDIYVTDDDTLYGADEDGNDIEFCLDEVNFIEIQK